MRIGVPSETKTLEGRVALVPAACADLVADLPADGQHRVEGFQMVERIFGLLVHESELFHRGLPAIVDGREGVGVEALDLFGRIGGEIIKVFLVVLVHEAHALGSELLGVFELGVTGLRDFHDVSLGFFALLVEGTGVGPLRPGFVGHEAGLFLFDGVLLFGEGAGRDAGVVGEVEDGRQRGNGAPGRACI